MQGPDQVHMELHHRSHTGSAAVLCNKYSCPDQLLCREYTTYEAFKLLFGKVIQTSKEKRSCLVQAEREYNVDGNLSHNLSCL